jgi:hypothetical protein
MEYQMTGRGDQWLAYELDVAPITARSFLLGSAVTNDLRDEDAPELAYVALSYADAIAIHPVTVDQFRPFIASGANGQRHYCDSLVGELICCPFAFLPGAPGICAP